MSKRGDILLEMQAYVNTYNANQVTDWHIKIPLILSFFRAKGALSEMTAVKLSKLDIVESGLFGAESRVTNTGVLKAYNFVHITFDGRYWLDEKELETKIDSKLDLEKMFKSIFAPLAIVAGVVVITTMVLPFLSEIIAFLSTYNISF